MTYLSIDLDYWFRPNQCEEEEFVELFKLLEFVKGVPNRILVQDHHHILPHINSVRPRSILHVDYHQDIAFPYFEGDSVDLTCGTFFYFVEGRKEMSFKWYYPEFYTCVEDGMGLCVDRDFVSPFARSNFIFKSQRHKLGLPTKRELAGVEAVGIAVSQDYSDYGFGRLPYALKALKMLYDMFGKQEVRSILSQFRIQGFYAPL